MIIISIDRQNCVLMFAYIVFSSRSFKTMFDIYCRLLELTLYFCQNSFIYSVFYIIVYIILILKILKRFQNFYIFSILYYSLYYISFKNFKKISKLLSLKFLADCQKIYYNN